MENRASPPEPGATAEPDLFYRLARAGLFRLPPETAHGLTLGALRQLRWLGSATPLAGSRERQVMGLTFRNPVGLAAGWDKDARAMDGAARLGFGCVEVGTVTPLPQPGNPRPRLFRLPAEQALINRMGFNNGGLAALLEQVRRFRQRNADSQLIVGINIGKNKATPVAEAGRDYLTAFTAVAPLADYVTVNLSSPNTPGLRSLQSREALRALLGPLKERQQQLATGGARPVPMAVKIAPDLTEDEQAAIAEELLAAEVEGLIATNTTISRPLLAAATTPQAEEAGGLSGRPLTDLSRQTVARFHALLGERIPIIGVGGISSAADAEALLEAGASLVQLYTGFIYQGPALVRAVARL